MDECVVGEAAFLQPRPRGTYRILLDVKGIDMPALPDRATEKFGVVAVAHREVGGDAALGQVRADEHFVHFKQVDHSYFLKLK